jgi:transposase
MSKTSLSNEKLIHAWVMRAEGLNNRQIAKKFNVGPSWVSRWITIVNKTPALLEQAEGLNKARLANSTSTETVPSLEETTSTEATTTLSIDYPKAKTKVDHSTIASRIRSWLATHPDGTRQEYIAETGHNINSGQFSYTKHYVGKPKKSDPVKTMITNSLKQADTLVDENAFLRWWCQGERAGFVDRLLQELKK